MPERINVLSCFSMTWPCQRSSEYRICNGQPNEVEGGAQSQGMAPELLGRYERARERAVKEFGLLRSEDLARAIHYSLTRSEARHLENSPDAHAIRDRLIAAGLESRALPSDAATEPLTKSEPAGHPMPSPPTQMFRGQSRPDRSAVGAATRTAPVYGYRQNQALTWDQGTCGWQSLASARTNGTYRVGYVYIETATPGAPVRTAAVRCHTGVGSVSCPCAQMLKVVLC